MCSVVRGRVRLFVSGWGVSVIRLSWIQILVRGFRVSYLYPFDEEEFVATEDDENGRVVIVVTQ